MTVHHIVLYQFKPDAKPDAIQKVCNRVIGMKDACIHPATNKPYIKSAIGGRDNSPSGYQRGMTHAFVMEFENEADQHYYLTQDSSHTGLVQYIRDAVEGVQLIDFIPGRW